MKNLKFKSISMKKISIVIIAIFITSSASVQAQRVKTNRNNPERQEWLRDLGFGMFIHWGIDSQLGIVISHSLVGASEDYVNRYFNELPKTFDPTDFDPYKIAKQAKLAGMKYIVFTTKHHSGFCMWDTKTTDFNITNTLYQEDILKKYVDGVRKAGLAVGFYFSPEDFKFLHENNKTIRRFEMELDEDFLEEYRAYVRRQTNELFSNYGKIDVFFIDGGYGKLEATVANEAWDLQPELVITRGVVNTPENRIPGEINDQLWETCMIMGTQWQYKPTNDNLKSGGELIEKLIETRAKGGNWLLNIGLDPFGEIPDPEARNLTEVAAWYFINQEAILNVRPWVTTREENIWFTASRDRKNVYAIITGIPDWRRGTRKEFILGSVQSTPQTKISVLGENHKVIEYRPKTDPKAYFTQTEDGLQISVVRGQSIYKDRHWPNPIVVKLENIEPSDDPAANK